MGEIKSVKVDNWGVFFLQKLQNFFNKTDYCDLTLQFNDNSQLKVHRLVLSACTDYFNVLEQTCEMIDDILIMPLELQADVVVPIVNFMYTGTLEFELRMYSKLLKTARDMNMTVLSKLLEAHRRTMEKNTPIPLNKNVQRNAATFQRRAPASATTSHYQQQQRRIQSQAIKSAVQMKPTTSYYPAASASSSSMQTKQVKGPIRIQYDYSLGDGKTLSLPPEVFEPTFDSISYESKPLICKEEPDSEEYSQNTSSPFEELRRGYNNNKRPASSVSSFSSPPDKKPNIEDVKEYAEQQRVRKQIAQEFDDDGGEYDEIMEDAFHNDDDDDEFSTGQVLPSTSGAHQQKQQQTQQQKVSSQQQGSPNTITIKQENNRQTIVVRDTSNANHAQIISEVLKKYPHLIKSNKNIKLKILPQGGGGSDTMRTEKVIIKKDVTANRIPVAVPQLPQNVKRNTYSSASGQRLTVAAPSNQEQKNMKEKNVPAVSSTSAAPNQPRRIDSKTMHSLIAMGAENRTGPWLCLECGVNGRPISIPSYRGFRRHLINIHKQQIDPRLCEHCGWRSTNVRELHHHMIVEHKIKPQTTYNFPKCEICSAILLDNKDLEKHILEIHTMNIDVNQCCIYCNKTFADETTLYAHMKAQHKKRAKEDGVVDFSDDNDTNEEDDEEFRRFSHTSPGSSSGTEKIKIISDISLPKNIPIIQAANNAPGTTITLPPDVVLQPIKKSTSEKIHVGPKFVNADGKEMHLTEEQRQEIISQLEGQDHDGVVMVLSDENIVEESDLTSLLSSSEQGTIASETKESNETDLLETDKKKTTIASMPVKKPVEKEKEQHKPRKTKHTVKTEILDEGEEMIEWLDDDSGKIIKVPISKFTKLTEMKTKSEEEDNGDDDDDNDDDHGDEGEAKDGEEQKIKDELESDEEEIDEEKSKLDIESNKMIKNSSDNKIPKTKETVDKVHEKRKSLNENDESTSETTRILRSRKINEKKIEVKEKNDTKKSKKDKLETSEIKNENDDHSKKAMETLKILTGDWSDDDEDDNEDGIKKEPDDNHQKEQDKEKCIEQEADQKNENQNEKKEQENKNTNSTITKKENSLKSIDRKNSSNEEILFESLTFSETSNVGDSKEIENNDKNDKEDDDMDLDTSIDEILRKNREKQALEESESLDDDMRILEELKNYEENRLSEMSTKKLHKKDSRSSSKQSIENDEKSKSEKRRSKSNSASPTVSDTDNEMKKSDQSGVKQPIVEQLIKHDEMEKITSDDDDVEKEMIEKEKTSDDEGNKKNVLDDKKNNAIDETKEVSQYEDEGTEEKYQKHESDANNDSTGSTAAGLMTKVEIRNLISDWGDDDDDDEDL